MTTICCVFPHPYIVVTKPVGKSDRESESEPIPNFRVISHFTRTLCDYNTRSSGICCLWPTRHKRALYTIARVCNWSEVNNIFLNYLSLFIKVEMSGAWQFQQWCMRSLPTGWMTWTHEVRKLTIELDGHSPNDAVVSNKLLRVTTCVNGKLIPTTWSEIWTWTRWTTGVPEGVDESFAATG